MSMRRLQVGLRLRLMLQPVSAGLLQSVADNLRTFSSDAHSCSYMRTHLTSVSQCIPIVCKF